MKKYTFTLILIIFFINSCEPPCFDDNNQSIYLTIDDLNQVPYKIYDQFEMKHSNGKIVKFTVTEQITKVENFNEDCTMIQIEQNITTIKPDYPIFDIIINIQKNDNINLSFQTGLSSFYLTPTYNDSTNYEDYRKFYDSLEINQKYYYNVLKIKENEYGNDSVSIKPKYLYFNQSKGILKIEMSNNEFYEISE